MKKNRRVLFLMWLGCLITLLTSAQVPFTAGNIVALRVGDGSASLTNAGAPIFIDEFGPSGILIQSIAMPVATVGANNRVTLNGALGTGSASGLINLSTNGQYLVFGAINAPLGSVSPNGQTLTLYSRAIGLVRYDGAINTTTSLGDAFSAGVPNVASTNGTDLWAVGSGGVTHNGLPTNGIRYTTTGSTTSVQLNSDVPTGRQLVINNNKLYMSTSNQPPRLGILSNGLPTTTGQTVTNVAGFPTTPNGINQFVFFDMDTNEPGVDVLYVVNDRSDGGIQKYSLVSGVWTLNSTITSGSGIDQYIGLTAMVSGVTVTLFASRTGSNTGGSTSTTVRGGEIVTITDVSGYNQPMVGSPIVISSILTRFGANNVAAYRGLAPVPQGPSVKLAVKTYLQGVYSDVLGRHKDVSPQWATVLQGHALAQPFNTAAFGNYAGTEGVLSTAFAATAGSTDLLDWVLLELRDSATHATVISRRAAFIREDGRVVDLDGVSDVKFTNVESGNYYVVIRHRNHLPIRSASTLALSTTATLYDFTTAQNKAFQDVAITTNAAMKDLSGTGAGPFVMWAGNANTNTSSRASGPDAATNDFLHLVNIALSGNVATILGPPTGGNAVYHIADLNMDGSVRASGPDASVNDYLFLVNTVLGGNVATIISAHQ